MTDIVFRFTNPTPSGVDAPAQGRIDCSLVALEVGEATRTIRRFSVTLRDGRAVIPLSPTSAAQAWRLEVVGVEGVGTFYKAVPSLTETRRYDQLADIDPATLVVTESGQAAWDETLRQIEQLADQIGDIATVGTVRPDPAMSGVVIVTFGRSGPDPLPSSPPQILSSPIAATARAGEPVTFTVAVAGNPAPAIQWQVSLDGALWTDVPGATAVNYQLTNPQIADAGKRYRARAQNDSGTAYSEPGILTVIDPDAGESLPVFVIPGADNSFVVDIDTIVFDVRVEGIPTPVVRFEFLPRNATSGEWAPLAYTRTAIAHDTGATRFYMPTAGFSGYQPGDLFRVRVIATNSVGSVISPTHTVTVYDVP